MQTDNTNNFSYRVYLISYKTHSLQEYSIKFTELSARSYNLNCEVDRYSISIYTVLSIVWNRNYFTSLPCDRQSKLFWNAKPSKDIWKRLKTLWSNLNFSLWLIIYTIYTGIKVLSHVSLMVRSGTNIYYSTRVLKGLKQFLFENFNQIFSHAY